jgi:hypothetical protein
MFYLTVVSDDDSFCVTEGQEFNAIQMGLPLQHLSVSRLNSTWVDSILLASHSFIVNWNTFSSLDVVFSIITVSSQGNIALCTVSKLVKISIEFSTDLSTL